MSDLIASATIEENSKEYARYILASFFPNPTDGLKRVHRRIINNQPQDQRVGGAILVANTLKTHPYGDSATYDTACRLAEPFSFTFPLIDNLSAGGTYSGSKAAASRYTKFKLSDFCLDVFFKGIDKKTIPMEPTEDLEGVEPKYLIPKIPTALLFAHDAIGYGFSSRTVPLKLENICDLVIDFIESGQRDTWTGTHLPHLFLPKFPVEVELKNHQELIQQYSNGNFEAPIETEGVYTILSPNSVLIRTLSYSTNPESVLTRLIEALKDKNHWLVKDCDAVLDTLSEGQYYVDFRITVKRTVNILDVIDKFRSIIRLRGTFHPINHWCHVNAMSKLDPHSVIKIWYKERYRSRLGTLKYRQQHLFLQKMKTETYLVISDHVEEVVNNLRKHEPETIYQWLKERFDLSPRQCELLLTANLQILMKSKKKELEEQLEKTKKDLEDIQKSFLTIDQDIATEIRQLRKKYSTRNTFVSTIPAYIGCLIIQGIGTIQIRNQEELFTLAKIYHVPRRFVSYRPGVKYIRIKSQDYKHIDQVPYTTQASQIKVVYGKYLFISQNGRSKLIEDDNTIPVEPGIVQPIDDPNNCWMIQADGKMSKYDGKLSNVKATRALYLFEPTDEKYYVVLSVDERYQNHVKLQKVKLGDKVKFVAGGDPHVIGVVPLITDSVWCSLPEGFKWNMLEATDFQRYLKKQTIVDVSIRNWSKF